jgi:hypothetical protein
MNLDNEELKEKNVKVRKLPERGMQQIHWMSSCTMSSLCEGY